jgi:tetratricopeptide (TPR) repeat protein
MELEKPLGEIKAGTFDRATFKKAFDTQAEANRAAMLIRKEQTAITKLIKDGKYDEAKVKIAEFEAKNPKIKMEAARFLLLSKQDPKGFNAKVDELSSKGDGQKSQILISFAMDQAQKGGNVDQGRTVIKALVKNAKKDDVMPHYYAALFYGETNEPKLALDAIEKAIAIYPTSNLKDNKQAKAAFDKMKDDFSAKVKAKSK